MWVIGKINNTFDTTGKGGKKSYLSERQQPAHLANILKNILHNTFKHNHHEDLELSNLNYSQRNYLTKMLKNDQNKLPFKLPYRDEESDERCKPKKNVINIFSMQTNIHIAAHFKQMTQSMHLDSFEGRSTSQNFDSSKIQNLKLPKLESALDSRKVKVIERRFNSVKAREKSNTQLIHLYYYHFSNNFITCFSVKDSRNSRANTSAIMQNSRTKEDSEESKIPTSWLSVTEALPLAIVKKRKLLEKRDEDEEVHIK